MKNILIIDNKGYGIPQLIQGMERMGWHTKILEVDIQGKRKDVIVEEKLEIVLNQGNYDAVFSFNYYVLIAEFCHRKGLVYISWVYDSPLVSLYSYTMIYDTNYVFLFDYMQYQELKNIGLKNVFHLPLASNTFEMRRKLVRQTYAYQNEISFVGNLYNDKRNNLYAKIEMVDSYTKGYIDALVDMQKKIYGSYILREGLSNSIVAELQKVCPYAEENAEGVETANYIYADYFLARKVTQQERVEVLKRLSQKHPVTLYSGSKTSEIPEIKCSGKVDYYNEMPDIFRRSKINLNISLKSIQSGIPLRCMDIMGVGGFLVTNYQMEMEEYFSAGVHYDYYGSMEELEDKVEFYLKNEAIREKIAYDGYEIIKKEFNYQKQLGKIQKIVWNY